MPLNYTQLLETNNLIQQNVDESYWLCVTRTVQESKLFPVPSYMMLSYLMAFYRYPSLLRKIESRMSAEELGDRSREMAMKHRAPGVSWGLPNFYLLGREWLINLGVIKPTDAIEDVMYVMDFWKRFQLSLHRNDGHISRAQYGHRGQTLSERQAQVFHSDLYSCEAGDELHEAAHQFMASASQYGFLISCESRISLHNHGPYKLSDTSEMIVRDFMDLAESDFPWLDGVAKGVEYNNITVTMAAKDCHFYLVDDWGSFEAEPEFSAEKLVGVGLYASDNLSEGYMPLGMNSREELIATFKRLDGQVKEAMNNLWRRIAGYSRDQMMDAGAITYFAIIKDLAHIAGVYDVDDWMKVDERAERFRPLLNDEYGRDVLGELVGLLSNPSQKLSDYSMMMHSNAPTRMYTPIPYSVLSGEPYTPTAGPLYPGITNLPEKDDVYTTTRGKMTLAEYNRQSQEFTPSAVAPETRFLCDTWLKYHAGSDQADSLYRITQASSRKLAGKGSTLTRDEVEALRD
ncbi:hypothetical protein E1832_13680 [Antarcticimicrobium luteum]|uniref:Uncharacterized protein n=2 Tax=Antarcticimicrobium luteum TaxID=2547397 RepID=A0A4R5V1S2_9RHOB|nr:hypothetical protein E1832_13680 [Antarcticimicrobium luteum]